MLLLENIRFLITQNEERKVLENVDILVKQDRIFEIGKNLSDHYSRKRSLIVPTKLFYLV